MHPILIDIARYGHILAVAVGFGTAVLTDLYVLSRIEARIGQRFLASVRSYHRVIWASVIAMWVTGLALVYIRTGFNIENFSPKLFAKLLTVALLTVNAKLISMVVLPMLDANLGRSLMWLPLRTKLGLAAIGAISTSSWMLALAMGSSKVLAASGWLTFVVCVPIVYSAAIFVAVLSASLMHSRSS